MGEFISEDDLKTFEGWLRYQAIDASMMTEEELSNEQHIFDEAQRQCAANPKVGLMKLQPVPGEYKYAVAVREGTDLWLLLWVRYSHRSGFFVMQPVGNRDWDPHTSYHLDGRRHMKSYGNIALTPDIRQPLTGQFHGNEDLGIYQGYGPKGVGAICDPTAFSGVVEVSSGVLGPSHGAIAVALVEPGHEPPDYTWGHEIVTQTVFRDVTPNVVITVMRHKPLKG